MSGSATGRRVASLDTDRPDAVASSPPFPGPHSIKAPVLPRDDTPWATRSPRLPDVQQQERQQQEGMRKGSPKVYKHLLQSSRSMSPSCRSAASYRAAPLGGGSLSPINHVGSPAQHSPKTSILQTARHLSFTGNPPTALSRLQAEEVQKELNEYSNQILQQQQQQQQQQQPGTPLQQQQQQHAPQTSPLQALLGARLALEACDSPERPMRRATTTTPLHMFAVHHSALEATQQQQAASGTAIRPASAASNAGGMSAAGPSWMPPSGYSHLGLDVHECLASLGSDTPCDSPCSGCTNPGSLDSPHPPSTSRLGNEQRRLLPRPPSSSGGSASSTPHSATGGALQPHPPPPPFLQRKNSQQGKALAPLQEHGAPGSYQESSPLACMELGGAGGRPYSGRRHRVAPPLGGLDLSRSSSFTSSSAPASTSSLAPSSGTRAAPTLNMGVFASGGFMSSSLGHDSSQPSSPTGSMQLRPGLGGSSPLDEAAYRQMSNSYGSASDLGLNSPVAGAAAAAAAAQRPSSGRQKPAQLLAEAVKSNNLGSLEKTIRYLTEETTGTVAGLNDRHPLSQHTALSEAVSQNNKAMVERLLAAGSNPNIGHISQGGPLLLAAGYGHLAMVECLLKAGADPKGRDGMAATALHAAMASGHINIAVLLLQHGSDPNATNENGERPFELVKDVSRLVEQVGPELVVALAGGRDQLSPNTAGLLGHALHQQHLQQQQQQQPLPIQQALPPTGGGHAGSLPRNASSGSSLGGIQPMSMGSLGGVLNSFTRRHSLTGSAAGTPRSCGGGGTPPISPPALKDGVAPEGTTLRPCPPEAPRELSSNSSSYGPRSRVHSAVESVPGEGLLSVDSRGAEEERAPTPPVLTLPSQFPHLRKSRTLTKGGAQQEDILASFREEDQDLLKAAQSFAVVGARPEGSGVGPSSSGRSEAWLPSQSPLSNNSSAAQLPVSARSEMRSSKGSSPASHVTTPVAARAAGALGTSPAHGNSMALGGSIMSRVQEAAAAASQVNRQQQAKQQQQQQQQQQTPYRHSSAQQQQQQHRPQRPVTPQQDMQHQPAQQSTPPQHHASPFSNGFAMLSCGTPVRFGLPPGGSSDSGAGTPSGSSSNSRPSLQVPSLPRFGFGSSPLAAFDMGDSVGSLTGQQAYGSDGASHPFAGSSSGFGASSNGGGGGSGGNGLTTRLSNSQGGSFTSANACSSNPFHRPVGTSAAAAQAPAQAANVATPEDSPRAVSSTAGAASIPALEGAFGSVTAASSGVSPEQSSEQLPQDRAARTARVQHSAPTAAHSADGASQPAASAAVAAGHKRLSPTSESPGMSPQQVEGAWGSCACTPPQSPSGVVSALVTPPPASAFSPTKPILASAGGGVGSRSSRSKAAAQQQQQQKQQQQQQQQQGGRGAASAAAGSAATGAAPWLRRSPGGDSDEDEDDLAAAAAEADDLVPPLIRASSPDAMSPKGPLGELPVIKQLTKAGHEDAEKVTRAAEELRKVAVDASAEAVEVRAAHMFGKCVDVRTGNMPWTRGELLGEGAYGKVYAGLNQFTGELMAVKALQLGRGNSGAASAHLQEVLKELELYKNLKHKHVVGYIDARYEPAENTLFIFLEYVPGGSIASMLERFGCFHTELVRKYTRQLLQGLEFLHTQHIVHRDLKGANVLVTRNGIIKLADFGASKVYCDARTDAMKSMRGSVYWMAPEVIKGSYGRRADIWSLGCTVIEMLTGRHPWPDLDNHFSTMYAIVNNTEGPPRPASLDPLVGSFLDECLKHDFMDRPTASQLLQHPWIAGEAVDGAQQYSAEGAS